LSLQAIPEISISLYCQPPTNLDLWNVIHDDYFTKSGNAKQGTTKPVFKTISFSKTMADETTRSVASLPTG
jgi:hypothetical protein